MAPSPKKVLAQNNTEVTKQPGPPRTAFVCFKDEHQEALLAKNPGSHRQDAHALVATAWKNLTPKERAQWEEVSRQDKTRFLKEKQNFKGVWIEPQRRKKKDPTAPKRPMSAFLKYSKTRRTTVKEENPDMSNTDVSRLLGEMWRNSTDEERRPYVEAELIERAEYKERVRVWKEEKTQRDDNTRQSHQNVTAQVRSQQPPPREYKPRHYDYRMGRHFPGGGYQPPYHPNPHHHHPHRPYSDFPSVIPHPPPPPPEAFRVHPIQEAVRKVDERTNRSGGQEFQLTWPDDDMPIPPPPPGEEDDSEPSRIFQNPMDPRHDGMHAFNNYHQHPPFRGEEFHDEMRSPYMQSNGNESPQRVTAGFHPTTSKYFHPSRKYNSYAHPF